MVDSHATRQEIKILAPEWVRAPVALKVHRLSPKQLTEMISSGRVGVKVERDGTLMVRREDVVLAIGEMSSVRQRVNPSELNFW